MLQNLLQIIQVCLQTIYKQTIGMDYKKVLNSVNTHISAIFTPLGFTLKKRANGLYVYKDTDFCRQFISIEISNYTIEFSISATFMTCFRKVAALHCTARGLDEKWDLDFSYTVSARNKDYDLVHFVFHEEQALHSWCYDTLKPYYQQQSIPFFEATNTLDKVDNLLNDAPLSNLDYLNDICTYAQTGLVVAKLNHNPHFDNLATVYYEKLDAENAVFEYKNVMNYLKTI
jgi:hypothetical protein